MAGPLSGLVRILDLSERSPSAAIAGMVLADLGAEVIRVEPEGGDPLRAGRLARVASGPEERNGRAGSSTKRAMGVAAQFRRCNS